MSWSMLAIFDARRDKGRGKPRRERKDCARLFFVSTARSSQGERDSEGGRVGGGPVA